jgi:hypothetical protein
MIAADVPACRARRLPKRKASARPSPFVLGDARAGVVLRHTVPLFLLLAVGQALAEDCGGALPTDKRRVDNAHYVVVYATAPAPIVLNEHFAVDVAVCARAGASAPQSVGVDATMPEHKHGMNYRATVTDLGGGRYRAEGLLFHMPGRWELTFDVVANGAVERLASAIVVQ